MSSKELGFGKGRLFRLPQPLEDRISFVAPAADGFAPELLREELRGTVGAREQALLGEALRRERSRFQPLPEPTGDAPYPSTRVTGKYYAVPWDEGDDRGERVDIFHLDLESRQLVAH